MTNKVFTNLPGTRESQEILPRIGRLIEEWVETGEDQLLVGELSDTEILIVMIGDSEGLKPVLELFRLEPKERGN